MPAAPAVEPPVRDTKQAIVTATLAVISQHGTAGATVRRIAEQAGVSPGTLTYHFPAINDVLAAAFARMVGELSEGFAERLAKVEDIKGARAAVIDLIVGKVWINHDPMLLTYELYAFVTRHPEHRALMTDWLARTHQTLRLHFTAEQALMVDAMIEGCLIHNSLAARPMDRKALQRMLERLTG